MLAAHSQCQPVLDLEHDLPMKDDDDRWAGSRDQSEKSPVITAEECFTGFTSSCVPGLG